MNAWRSLSPALVPRVLLTVVLAGCGNGSGTKLPIPAVTSTVPAADATGVNRSAAVVATFNQSMNVLTIINTDNFQVSDPAGNIAEGTVSYDSTTNSAVFTPSPELDSHTTYTVSVSSAVVNLAYRPLPADVIWTFTTGS